MSSSHSLSAMQSCEDILRQGIRYNTEHHILPSENAVAERLLARGLELKDAYEELHSKLHSRPPSLEVFLGLILSTTAYWNPEKLAESRTARGDLESVNRKIASKAAELASLIEHRSELHNRSGFSSDTHYHVCDVIEAASADNGLFHGYLREPLDALRARFDLKYWPSLGQVLRELAKDANDAILTATDPLTAAATAATRPSRADFLKALVVAIEENCARHHGHLPRDFKVTDKTLASLTNCALNLNDNLIDDTYVKRFRQRERESRNL